MWGAGLTCGFGWPEQGLQAVLCIWRWSQCARADEVHDGVFPPPRMRLLHLVPC